MSDVIEREATTAVATVNAERLISQAIERNLPIESLERLLAMREKLLAEAAKSAFLDALSRFQAECPVIRKTKKAEIKSEKGSFSYKYAPLDKIVSVVAPLLTRHGLSYSIVTALEDRNGTTYVIAKCSVYHTAGHSESSEFFAPIDRGARMNDMQKHASAQTYAKRYAFCNALGILTGDDDDDGRSTGKPKSEPEPQAVAQPRSKSEPAAPQTPASVSPGSAPSPDSTSAGAASKPLTPGQARILRAKLKQYSLTDTDLKAKFGRGLGDGDVQPDDGWMFSDFEKVTAWIAEHSGV